MIGRCAVAILPLLGFKASAQDTTDMEVVASWDGTNTLFKTNYVDAARDYSEYYSDARYKQLIREGYLEGSSSYQRDILIMAVQRGDTNVLAKLLVAAPAMVKDRIFSFGPPTEAIRTFWLCWLPPLPTLISNIPIQALRHCTLPGTLPRQSFWSSMAQTLRPGKILVRHL